MVQRYNLWVKCHTRTLRVAGSYLFIIMAMSIAFSAMFYYTSVSELGRQVPPDRFLSQSPDADYDSYHDFFRERISQGRNDLLGKLIVINLATLVTGGMFSYWLARRTLRPIEYALDAQSRFASDASHELRTPLAVIQSENEVALRNPRLSLARSKELLRSNLDEVTRLQALSEGLLRLARGAGDITLAPVSLADVTSEAINHCLKAAQLKNIRIKDSVARLHVLSDATSLTQAIVVLLDNAIKYSPEDSTVHIESKTVGRQAQVIVKDQGRGIAPHDLPHIFERFYRADQSRSKQNVEGHGLGLALASQIVQQFGGELTASSEVGKGSTFTITLPLAQA